MHLLRAMVGRAIQIRYEHDREFQPLRLMNGHQPHDVRVFRERRGQRFLRLPRHVLRQLGDEVGQPERPAALETARLLDHLPQIRQFALAEEFRQQRGIVTGQRHRPLDQLANPQPVLTIAQLHNRRGGERHALPLIVGDLGRLLLGKQARGQTIGVLCQPKQRFVRKREQSTAQCAGQADFVARTDQRSQQVQKVEDLLLGVEGVAADQVVVNPVTPQRLLVQLDVRQRAKQDGDVAGLDRARLQLARAFGIGRADERLAVVEHRANASGDPIGLAATHAPDVFLRRPARRNRPQEFDGRRGRDLRPMRVQRLVVRSQFVPEQRVDELENRRLATKVFAQHQPACLGRRVAQLTKHVGVGAAKTIDRLLVVAHEKQLPAADCLAAQGLDQLDLHAVGILKLVDQQQTDLRRQAAPQRIVRGIDQQGPGPSEQVVEVQRGQFPFSPVVTLARAGGDRQ